MISLCLLWPIRFRVPRRYLRVEIDSKKTTRCKPRQSNVLVLPYAYDAAAMRISAGDTRDPQASRNVCMNDGFFYPQAVLGFDVRSRGPALAAKQSPRVGGPGRGLDVPGRRGHEQVRHQQAEGASRTAVSVDREGIGNCFWTRCRVVSLCVLGMKRERERGVVLRLA